MNEAREDGKRENELEADLDRWRSESPAAGRYSEVQEKRKEKNAGLRRNGKNRRALNRRRAV